MNNHANTNTDTHQVHTDQPDTDTNHRNIDQMNSSPTEADPVAAVREALLAAVTICATILFSLREDGVTLAQLSAAFPDLFVIAQVGTSYSVSLPESQVQRFLDANVDLADPRPEDLEALHAASEAKLVGFFS